MNVNKLVRMANQIADNFSYGDEAKAAAGVCDHIRRFWTPQMRQLLVEHASGGAAGLNNAAAMAVTKLAEEQAHA